MGELGWAKLCPSSILAHWVVQAIALVYDSAGVPPPGGGPLHQSYGYLLGTIQGGTLGGHLCSSRLALFWNLSKVLQAKCSIVSSLCSSASRPVSCVVPAMLDYGFRVDIHPVVAFSV